ncbi:MAG: CpsD/CapB family tyrosine-protein kinase, partial [Clostridia bacterium]|nr:CpsD/CapB family tyrosine-protein kinase [Clostridia bacterium]
MATSKNPTPIASDSPDKAVFGKNLGFAASEAYRLLRTNIMFSLPIDADHRCRVIGITSANAGEGKSTTALNLAYMLAEARQQTILVEADMRLPTISKRLG